MGSSVRLELSAISIGNPFYYPLSTRSYISKTLDLELPTPKAIAGSIVPGKAPLRGADAIVVGIAGTVRQDENSAWLTNVVIGAQRVCAVLRVIGLAVRKVINGNLTEYICEYQASCGGRS